MIDTTIDIIYENDIMAKLRTIAGVSVLNGFLVHYANDLMNGDGTEDSPSFPCIAAELGSDEVNSTGSNYSSGRITRQLKIIGCVDVLERELVNKKLNNLVLDVRKALCINKFDAQQKRKTLSKNITLGGTFFKLPDNVDQYAYFEMDITIEYTEEWQ